MVVERGRHQLDETWSMGDAQNTAANLTCPTEFLGQGRLCPSVELCGNCACRCTYMWADGQSGVVHPAANMINLGAVMGGVQRQNVSSPCRFNVVPKATAMSIELGERILQISTLRAYLTTAQE